MRIRCLAFLPPAAAVTGAVFLLTSSIVSAIESNFATQPPPRAQSVVLVKAEVFPGLSVMRAQTDCQSLSQGVEQVSGASIRCETSAARCEFGFGECRSGEWSSQPRLRSDPTVEPSIFLF